MYEGTSIHKWTGSGNWTALKTNFSSATEVGMISAKESGLSPDDVVIIQNGVDNAFRLDSAGNFQDLGSTSGTGNDSPPKSTVMCWYGNRVWILKDTLLYFSDAYPADYSTAFDTVSGSFRIPVGDERGLAPTRDMGIVVLGEQEIWAIAPSVTPNPSSDQPEPLLTDMGCVSKRGWAVVGDDIYFFAPDGLRALKRTIQDKLQLGASYPISYVLKDEFDEIDWSNIDKLSMVYFDNKLFITVPIVGGVKTWIYYPALNAFAVLEGWNINCYSTYKVSGEERLYYGHRADGKVFRAWYGYTDEGTTTTDGTAINYEEKTRQEDLGQPLLYKDGGEVRVKAIASGDYDVNVYASFDDSDYNLLGKVNLTGNLVTFPITFPVDFLSPNIVEKVFHLDSYGRWKNIKLKFQHNATNGNDNITILEHSIISFVEEYETE